MPKTRLEALRGPSRRPFGYAQWLLRMSGAFCFVALAACGERAATVIDGSSPQAFEQTTKAARRDLPDADRLLFDAAINTVPARRYANRDPAGAARIAFDGMTAAQVVAIEKERTRGEMR